MHLVRAMAANTKIAASISCNVRAVLAGRSLGRRTGAVPWWEAGMRPARAMAANTKIAASISYNVRTVLAGRRPGRRTGAVLRWVAARCLARAIAADTKTAASISYNVRTVLAGRRHDRHRPAALDRDTPREYRLRNVNPSRVQAAIEGCDAAASRMLAGPDSAPSFAGTDVPMPVPPAGTEVTGRVEPGPVPRHPSPQPWAASRPKPSRGRGECYAVAQAERHRMTHRRPS
jgi:hypothetical protein